MLVTFSVMALIFGASLARFTSSQEAQNLDAQQHLLSASLRQAQLFAFTGRTDGTTRPDNYGIHIPNGTSYILFSEDSATPTAYEYDAGSDTVVETITMQTNITIDQIGTDFAFSTPRGIIYIDGTAGAADVVITLTNAITTASKTVTIDGDSGRITEN